VRGLENTHGRCTIDSWSNLRITEPFQVSAVELDLFSGNGERSVLGMSGVERDVGALGFTDDMEGSVVMANVEGD